MENFEKDEAYFRARKRLKDLKGFYSHLTVYIVINAALLLMYHWSDLRSGQLTFEWWRFSTLFFWGIGLAAHALGVFGKYWFLNSQWEARKIKQFMEEEEQKRSQSYK
ncbi:MAG: 2TM domain-containing protein [Flavobacteriaceae bacterium]|nr:2TM domain-containing protein [Flavobacteriaceae bacterium]